MTTMTSNLKTSYGNHIERNCTVSITLDKRTSRKDVKVTQREISQALSGLEPAVEVKINYFDVPDSDG